MDFKLLIIFSSLLFFSTAKVFSCEDNLLLENKIFEMPINNKPVRVILVGCLVEIFSETNEADSVLVLTPKLKNLDEKNKYYAIRADQAESICKFIAYPKLMEKNFSANHAGISILSELVCQKD